MFQARYETHHRLDANSGGPIPALRFDGCTKLNLVLSVSNAIRCNNISPAITNPPRYAGFAEAVIHELYQVRGGKLKFPIGEFAIYAVEYACLLRAPRLLFNTAARLDCTSTLQ